MSKPYHHNSEFSIPPDDFSIRREHDFVPAFECPPEPIPPEEYAAPAPEILEPGSFVSEQRGGFSGKKLKKLLIALAAAASIFVFFRPLGLLNEPASAAVPHTDGNGSIVNVQFDPALSIHYALLDGNTVRYSYTAISNRQESDPDALPWKCPISVAAEVTDEQGNTAVPENDPDVWDRPREQAEYKIDASGLSSDMWLTLIATCDLDGEVKTAKEKIAVTPLPPAPEIVTQLTAAAAETDAGALEYTIDYSAGFTPDPSDTNDYDFTVLSFGIKWYNDAGEYRGGRIAGGDTDDAYLPLDMFRNGSGWAFTYSGPADLSGPDDATQFTVELKVQDQKTRIPFTIESEKAPIPGAEHREPVLPVADIVAFSFYSEMYGGITFSDMDDATAVALEIWDPNLETLEERRDITEEAVNDLCYSTGFFTTDLLFENHEEYYGQEDVPFPMSVEFRVVIEYGDGLTTTYTAMTREELNMFDAKYIPENDPWAGDEAGSIYCMTLPSVEYPDTEVVIDQQEKVTGPGIISISAEMDGVTVDPSYITINSSRRHVTFYGGVDDGKEADVVYRDILVRKPADLPDNEGHTAVLYITHYLESYDMVYTSSLKFDLKDHT